MTAIRMPFAGQWCKVWIYFGFVFAWAKGARPRFDTSTDMGLVLVPADAEVDSVIFRLRATDQDADFPLVFEITATITPVVRIDNLPCTLYNKVCQANVILTKRLMPGRLHDFAVRVRDTKGDSNSMQATISVTNATTLRDKIFPHIPSLIMVPEDTKPGKELDYLLVRANSWSGKPVYIELWQPKELFTIRQRQTPTQTRGIITLTGELDFETQSMYTLTMYATDPYTEQGKDTRNIAGLSVVVIVQDVQDVPPIFTLAPPLTRINNSVQPGDIILRVHAEDGDKGVPREIVYGLVSEGNPFTPFFNISETNGEITLAKPLEELTQITHVGAPVVLTVVAEEIRRSREEPPAQATVVDVGFLLGEPGNSPPYFESDNYVATIDENPEPGTVINFGEQYSARVKDEDIGKAGVFALKLENNNNTFEINPTVAERNADFIITVRDNTFIDYELYKVLSFKIVAQEVGPATNLSASVPATIFLRDINDNPPIFDEQSYEITLSENVTAGSRVIQVHATDKDTGVYGSIRYTGITGEGSQAFTMDSDTGLITVAMGSSLDREVAARLVLTVEARDENGNGNSGVVPLIVNLLDVNDNAPIFEKDVYEFMLNSDLTNFTSPALIKAIDADAEPPNNVVRYELVYGNYGKKFDLNETSGELILLLPITKFRQKKQSAYEKFSKKAKTKFVNSQEEIRNDFLMVTGNVNESTRINSGNLTKEMSTEVIKKRRKRADDDALYTLTARAYDLGVPHLSSTTKIRILSGIAMEARIMMFVVPGEQPNSTKTAETLAAITGGRVTVLETRPYVQRNDTGSTGILPGGGKKSIIVARVEQTEPGTSLVDVEKIREALAANGVGIIAGNAIMNTSIHIDNTNVPVDGTHTNVNDGQTTLINNTIATVPSEEVTVYKAENKLLFWLLIILVLLILLAIAALIICCICPGCPFYMAPRKRRVHSSETLVVRSDGRPKRHLHRQPAVATEVSWNGRKQAWSADPTRRNWQFNRRNVKNCSLPGDVAYISGQPNDVQMNLEAQRLRDGHSYDHSRKSRINEQERIYMEDVEDQKTRGYRTAELDSLQRHEMERGSDLQHQAYRQRFVEADMNEEPTVREQHFYREGNAEVLRLVTRGQVEDTTSHLHQPHHHRPTALIVDGKDIILQRFIEDQKSRHELSMQDIEAARSMESHQRSKEVYQQQQPEIILIPDRLDLGHRQHIEEIGPNVQRLVIDHGDYGSQKIDKESLRESQMRETMRQEKQEAVANGAPIADRPSVVTTDHIQANSSQYPFHDLELARQNALLTRLLLEKENRRAGAGGVDSTSYLETQSLPGQVAIATQTDRTAATQTERQVKSRSDNDESDEESRHRKKLKSRKKYGDGDWKRSRTLWMKSPIEEEVSPCFDKRLSILRKKVREVKEGRKISLEPDVLKEISDSLDGNGSSYKGEDDETMRSYQKTERTSISYKILNEKETGSQSSEEIRKERHEKSCEDVTDDQKMNVTESTSSPEIKVQREKYVREKADGKSPKKEGKSKTQKKSDSVIKPSFRILEKEFTMLTKRLSKLGDKKFQESTGSDSTSQEKSDSFAKEPKKDLDQKSAKKMDSSSSQKQTAECTASSLKAEQKGKQKKESAIAKTKQKLKYQQSQVMSTGSSEFDDALDKPKKFCGTRHESVKQKQPISTQGHVKVKRQTQMERREPKKQMSEFRDEEVEKRKEGPSKETPKAELKSERIGKMMTKTPKLGTISRKQNIAEETSTSTEEQRGGRDAFTPRDFGKKSSTDFSEGDSNGVQQRVVERFPKKIIEKFSDDFVEEPKKEIVEQQVTIPMGEERDTTNVEKHKIVIEKELCIPDTIQVSKNGLKWIRDTVEEPVKSEEHISAKKSIDDSTARAKEELITGFTAIDMMAETKKEKLSETIVRDRQTDKTSSEKEPTESIKYSDTAEEKESTQTDKLTSEAEKDIAERIKDKLEDYKEEDKSLDESKEQIEMKPVRELEERKQDDKEDDKYEYLEQKMKKLSKDVGEESVALKELKRALEVKVDALKEEKHNDKIGTVQKIEEPVEKYIKTEMPSNEQDSVRQDVTDESKIRGEEDKTDKTNGEEQKSVKHVDGSKLDHVIIEEKEGSIQATSSDQEKRMIDSDTIEVPREKETTSMIETYDRKAEENVFLDEQEKYDEDVTRIKPVDQIVESTFVDEDKKGISDKNEVMVEATTEDDKAVEKASEDYKITEKVTEDQKFDKKIMDDRNIFPEATMDQGVGREINKDQKIDEQAREIDQITREETFGDPKIIAEATKDQKMDKEITEGQKVDKEITKFTKMDTGTKEDDKILDKTADHKIIGVTGDRKTSKETTELEIAETVIPGDRIVKETIEDQKIDEKAAEGYKISKDATVDKAMTKSTTTDYKIGKETRDDDNIDGEATADQKIGKETKDDDDIAGKPTADKKIGKETENDDDIPGKPTAGQKIGKETKDDDDIAGKPTADQKIDKETKDNDNIDGEATADQKIGKETKDDDEIAGKPTADQKIGKETKDDDDIAGKPIADQKIGKETKDDDDIAGKPTADQKIDKETKDDDEIAAKPTADQKIGKETKDDDDIAGKPTADKKIGKETENDDDIAGKPTAGQKIGKETKDDDDIAGKPTADKKIGKETENDDDIAGKPTAGQKIGKETKDDDDIAGKPTADQKIDKETKDNDNIAGKPTADKKIGKETKDDDEIAGKPTAGQKIGKETKDDDDIAGKPTADQKIDKETKDDDEIAGKSTADQKIGKETKDDDDIAGKPTADQKIGKETKDDVDIAGEPIADQKIIETIEKQDTVKEETKHYKTVEKPTEDLKITEPEATYHKMVQKTGEDHTSVGDLGILTETIVDFIGKEKTISDEEKKISMEIDKDKVSEKEAVFLDKEKVPGEQAGITDLKSDDQQIDKEIVLNGKEEAVDITSDNDNEKRKSSSPTKKKTSTKKEVTKKTVASDDHKISERDVPIDTKKETRVEEEKEKEIVKSEETKEQVSIIDDKEKEKYHDKEEKITTEIAKIDDHPIEEKEINKGMQKIDDSKTTEEESTETEEIDDSQISVEGIVPETSEIKQQITIEKEDDTSTIQDYQIDKEVIPMKIPDDTTEEKDDSSKKSTTEKEDSETTKDSTEMPTSIDSDMKKESPMETSAVDDHIDKADGVFDTLTNGKGSIIPSTEKEIATIEQSSTNDRIMEKEVASLSFDNREEKEKNGDQISNINKSPTPRIDGESGALVEPPVDDKQTKEDAGKDKIIDLSDDDKIISTSKDAAKKVEQINVLEEAKEEESDEKIKIDDSSRDEATKLVAEEPVEKSEIGKPLKDEPASPAKESQDTAEELFEKTHEVSKEAEKLSDNETADSKLARTTEKVEQLHEPSGKVSSSFQEIELVKTSPQMYETTEKEKFAFDSTIRKASTDSGKISESEEQLKSESEQTELQEVEQFVEEQTFTAEEADIQREAFPEEQSNMGFNVPTIVPNGESDKQDLTKPKMGKTLPLEEDIGQEERQEIPVEEKFTDVSLPLFTSIIDTVVDSEDSDSSSDISRKTTLTTRPYQTPRHRAPQLSEKEISQKEEATELQDMEDEERVTISIEEIVDEDVESSKEDKMFVEFEDTSEAEEDKETVSRERTMDIQPHFSPKKIITATDREDMKKDEQAESGRSLEQDKESSISTKLESGTKEFDTKADRQDKARDKECSTSTKQVKDTKIDSGTRGYDRKPDRQDKVREKESSASTQRVKDTELEHEMKDDDKKVDKPDEPSLISKLAKTETFKVTDRRMKELEKKRVIPRRKKKSSSEESSEEKATHFHDVTSHGGYRTRRKLPEEQLKQKDSDQTKQSRKRDEESRRKQSLSKLKAEKEKKSSSSSEKYPTPPKTGEIDTSKTRPKYMAWYKKNREEMEKKRAELMATDDEEQLPRWLRRSMKNQKTEKEGKKLSSHKTADTTPRTRRKVKPLVNVESEQLKAIVRQGRKLRRAEGGKNEDPPVQIFAATPPSTSQDPKYHLLQHSEYKYEKISAPFYLHPPPAPHPSPQLSPERFDIPPTMEQGCTGEDFDSGIAISLQGGNRLRHQQLLEKKSVFDIAYSEAAPSQLRSDSTTPPS